MAVTLLLLSALASTGPSAASNHVEVYFELKLLVRDRRFLRTVAVDSWAGGRLLMEQTDGTRGSSRLELLRPLEDPWIFRWYPGRDDVKLGAAVSVPEPRGDAYDSLAALLDAEVRRRYEQWWDSDRVASTSTASPEWQGRVDRFWADRHRREEPQKDALSEPPVYPFHVLGDPAGRFRFSVRPDGSLDAESIEDRMSRPWLADGWARWQSGERRNGYGYWATKRPGWEPRTYETLAEALQLLAWSPLKETAEQGYELRPAALPRQIASVVETLLPRLAGKVSWHGETVVGFRTRDDATGFSVTGNGGPARFASAPRIACRIWRHASFDRDRGTIEADELQLLVTHDDEDRIKLWIRIGYRPVEP